MALLMKSCLRPTIFVIPQLKGMSTFSRVSDWYRNFWDNTTKASNPPYAHVCQIGDPVLRSKAEEVYRDVIKTPEIQKIISTMKSTLKHYNIVGLSAPQIGIPLRIILVEFTESTLTEFSPELRCSREMEVCPSTVIINPILEVVNANKIIFTEGCQSLSGYSASVPRYHEVKVSGLNENAEEFTWQVKGWLARIVQHEMDHLDGKFLTDFMDPTTFQFDNWYVVNVTKGQYRHRFK